MMCFLSTANKILKIKILITKLPASITVMLQATAVDWTGITK